MGKMDKIAVRKAFQSFVIAPNIPNRFRDVLHEGVVDISGATPYFSRLASDALGRISSEVEFLGDHRYKLTDPCFLFLQLSLREILQNRVPPGSESETDSDFVARALYRTAWRFGELPPDRTLDRFSLWPPSKPIEHAWRRFGKVEPWNHGTKAVFEVLPEGKLQLARTDFQLPRVGLQIMVEAQRDKLPKIAIEIEGEPIAVVLRAMYDLVDLDERRELRKESKAILSGLVKSILESFHVAHRGAHRPLINLGSRAAYLHDHKGISWSKVAGELCPLKHKHSENCRTNLRKQAKQWYAMQKKALERKIAASH